MRALTRRMPIAKLSKEILLYSYFNDKITYDWEKNDKEAENDCSSSGVYSDG
jgi:hypothetical protein